MIRITKPEWDKKEQCHVLWSRIICDNETIDFPEKLWFAQSGTEGKACDKNTSADAFVCGLLPVAMMLGEDLYVGGAVSAKLAYGLEFYQQVLNRWWPAIFKPVKLQLESVDVNEGARSPGVVCSFSGGVDSFYSVFRQQQLARNNEYYRLTHALMINGFDQIVDFFGEGYSRQLYRVYQPRLEKLGVQLVLVDSNLKAFRDRVFDRSTTILSFGSPLTSCAHALSSQWGRFLLAGHVDYAYENLKPAGAHPVLDHHLSSDSLDVIHFGADAGRTEKIRKISNAPQVQQSLRVCTAKPEFDEVGRVMNCGRCEKCLRTMLSLELLGVLDRFTTFPDHLDESLLTPELLSLSDAVFVQDNLALAKDVNDHNWVERLQQSLRLQQARRVTSD